MTFATSPTPTRVIIFGLADSSCWKAQGKAGISFRMTWPDGVAIAKDCDNTVTAALGPRRNRIRGKVPVTPGKLPVTALGRGKIDLHAGMSKLVSDVRGYVRLQAVKSSEYRRFRNELARKSEKRSWHPGMYKEMNRLAGYVDCRSREY